MCVYIVFLLLLAVPPVQGSCSLKINLLKCYIDHGFRNHLLTLNNLIPNDTVALMSVFLMGCSKVSKLTTCIDDAISSCDNLQDILPNKEGINAAFYGLCANKRAFEGGLACMKASKVNLVSCMGTDAGKYINQVAFHDIAWEYCSWKAGIFDCLINKYPCSIDFKYQYKAFQLSLLPPACQNYSITKSPWISKYARTNVNAAEQRLSMIYTKMYVFGLMLFFMLF